MPHSQDNSSDTAAPFFLRGSSSVFSRRQMDVFGSLQALEEAHNKVTKETKAERHLVRKMAWRATKPAVESLGAEKDARERQSSSQTSSTSPFKVPTLPPPRLLKRRNNDNGRGRGSYRFPEIDPLRDPSKWTHYSLADIDEDAGLGGSANRKIAADLMRELKQRREKESKLNDGEEVSGPVEVDARPRILFRPVSGKKKQRIEDSDTVSVPTLNPRPIQLEDSEEQVFDKDTSSSEIKKESPAPSDLFAFRPRKSKSRQLCGRLAISEDSEEEMEVSESESIDMSSSSVATFTSEYSNDSDNTNDEDDLEEAPEGL